MWHTNEFSTMERTTKYFTVGYVTKCFTVEHTTKCFTLGAFTKYFRVGAFVKLSTRQTIVDESNAAAGTSPNDSADHISHTPRLGGLFIMGNIYKYK
ncbi:hypothetical protein HID58_087520 [Brassica napus]|uniref:Uncharacterized protein n=1 Tax=Brassica napus TaxID=3708 RepID=A0ABQ7XUW7_BRANA|nr:hypothetical protein HID58_087520 [Brassica napus]